MTLTRMGQLEGVLINTRNVASHEVTIDQRLRRVDELDLEPIVFKLTHPEPGETCLTLVQVDADVVLYRCFLKLCLLYPGVTVVPTRRIDHVWCGPVPVGRGRLRPGVVRWPLTGGGQTRLAGCPRSVSLDTVRRSSFHINFPSGQP